MYQTYLLEYMYLCIMHCKHRHPLIVACVRIMLHYKMHEYVGRKLLVYVVSVMFGYHLLYIELHQWDHLFDIVHYNKNIVRFPSSVYFLVSINVSSIAKTSAVNNLLKTLCMYGIFCVAMQAHIIKFF